MPVTSRRNITDAQIPSLIARDSEVDAAIAAHEAKSDPHPNYVNLTADQTIRGSKAFSSTMTTSGQLIANEVNGSAELGSKTAANTPYVDFNSSGLNNDYDARIISTGGSATPGQAYLYAYCKQFIACQTDSSGPIAQTTGSALEARAGGSGAGAGAAILSFHRPGNYACYLGLDTDNQIKVGGWSMGAVAYRIAHEGMSPNFPSFLKINGTQVIADQYRGFEPVSGVTSPAAWNTGTITLAELAKRVGAIWAILFYHGLVGPSSS